MAITTNTLERTPGHQGSITDIWRVNASSADASGCETVKAAPGAGYELILTRLRVTIGGAVTATIGCGEESDTAKRVLFGPFGGTAMSVPVIGHDDEPVVLDPNSALTVDASGAGVIWVLAEGMTRVTEVAGAPSTSPSTSVSASAS